MFVQDSHHKRNIFYKEGPILPFMNVGRQKEVRTSLDLPSTVTFMMASATPPGFRASHLYCPSSLSVNSSKIKFVLFSSAKSILSLYQETCGFGKPTIMTQVRFSLSPSRMVQFCPNDMTSGGTKENKEAQKYNKVVKILNIIYFLLESLNRDEMFQRVGMKKGPKSLRLIWWPESKYSVKM